MIPKKSRLAQELRRAYFALRKRFGFEGELPLYREGNLYNFYLMQTGDAKKLDTLELNPSEEKKEEVTGGNAAASPPTAAASSTFRRPAKQL